ncbi:putative conserved NADP-binding domain-containing protein [Synechococcus sp. BIOS-E4-1]|uniref:SDR family oxidoreductase n=1 Tax=Synechococcus sp. BIOS-E4-1 TaxID=1400864 RepID=UPI001644B6A6|nr:SDR family oxidoreductase [Synechococcus sp. BIOS-E4-1]QNI52622.1 putative conserved NADP-binding domain-containing protein [Synechococcus sp. BIOS-E4-1]
MPESLVNRCRSLPTGSTLCILGAGFSGRRVAALAEALNIRVLTTRRNPDPKSRALRFDTDQYVLPSDSELHGVTHLLSTIPPGRDQTDPVLRTLGSQLSRLPLRWAGYLSTTGIYGDTGGAWVSETDAPRPGQDRSRRRLICEREWLNSGLPVQILRLPGIYGPGRSPLAAVKAGTLKPIHKPGQVFCRVHVDDIAAACLHMMHCSAAGQHPPVVNICDHEPAPSHVMQRHAADLLDCDLPEARHYEDAEADMSAMARSFWAENRRVSNDLLCKTLGYTLIHPNFRSGLSHCLEAERLTEDPTRCAPD